VPHRTTVVSAALLAAGLAFAGYGWSAESDRAAAAEPASSSGGPGPSPVTPVFSARRVPELLVRPQATRRLSAKLAPLVAAAPADTCLVVADGPTTLFAAKADQKMPAASNQKLVTALVALDVLGPDATFTTRVAAASAPAGGVVDGDLWVIGGGDPLIDSDTYQSTLKYGKTEHTAIEAIADQIVAAGVTSVTGSVKGDDSYYDAVRTIPSWPSRYLAQNQVGPLSALSVNDARTYPVLPGASSGTPRPASDPPAYAADALTQLLVARGVAVAGAPASGTAPDGLATVVEVPSLPLHSIVKEMLTFSDNNTAELLLKAVGRKDGGAGSTEAGLKVAEQVLAEQGLDLDGVVLLDGSGLDTGNRLSCRLLDDVLGDAGPTGPIADGLAVADGADGTLRDRFSKSPAAGRVRAKTGTLKAVTALSGWVRTTSERDVRFSTIVNTGGRDVTGSDLDYEAKVTEAILSYPDAVAPDVVSPKPLG